MVIQVLSFCTISLVLSQNVGCDQEMQEGIGAACVSTCGTGGLADELRRSVRNRESQWNVDFREESFSW